MGETIIDPRGDLETIRALMERARYYRHLPPQPPLLAGLLALGGLPGPITGSSPVPARSPSRSWVSSGAASSSFRLERRSP